MCASATKMLPSGAISTSLGSVNFVGGSPASPRRAEREQHLALRAELDDGVALALRVGELLQLGRGRRPRVDHPHVALLVDVHAVRPQDDAGAKALHDLAARIELDDGIDGRAGAGIGAATIAGPDVLAVGIDVDRADRSPLAAVGQRAEVADGLVGIRQVVDRGDLGVFGRAGCTAWRRGWGWRRGRLAEKADARGGEQGGAEQNGRLSSSRHHRAAPLRVARLSWLRCGEARG